MKLGVRDAARLLDVSEKTIYRWISQQKLPAYRVADQYRFNRAELLEWATSQRIPVSPQLLIEPDDASPPSLFEALRAGGVFYRVGGGLGGASQGDIGTSDGISDKSRVLRSVVEIMPLPDEVDRGFLLQVLLARESMGSTGIGEGIAIPHVRNPIVLHIPRPMVSLCFLERPIDFGAIDGKPVHTLFAIVSPTVKAHLGLLSKLSYALRQGPFAAAVRGQALRDEILLQAAHVESSIVSAGPGHGKASLMPAEQARM